VRALVQTKLQDAADRVAARQMVERIQSNAKAPSHGSSSSNSADVGNNRSWFGSQMGALVRFLTAAKRQRTPEGPARPEGPAGIDQAAAAIMEHSQRSSGKAPHLQASLAFHSTRSQPSPAGKAENENSIMGSDAPTSTIRGSDAPTSSTLNRGEGCSSHHCGMGSTTEQPGGCIDTCERAAGRSSHRNVRAVHELLHKDVALSMLRWGLAYISSAEDFEWLGIQPDRAAAYYRFVSVQYESA
jgi:hypothetical protein